MTAKLSEFACASPALTLSPLKFKIIILYIRITADCARQTGALMVVLFWNKKSGAIGSTFIAYYRRLRLREKKIFFDFFRNLDHIFRKRRF